MNLDYPTPNDPDLMYEQAAVTTNVADVTPIEHQHDHIVGNELRCSLHDSGCPVIFVKPTQVLEKGEDGTLHLVDKSVA